MLRRDFLTTCATVPTLGLLDIERLVKSNELVKSDKPLNMFGPYVPIEKLIKDFNKNEIGKKFLEDSILSQICHINYYTENPDPNEYACRYDHMLPNIGGHVDVHTDVHTYKICNSVDWLRKYDKNAFVINRSVQILVNSYIKRVINDAFHTMIFSGYDRNILVFDNVNNTFTISLISLMQEVEKNNNTSLTHLIVSPEAYESVGKRDIIKGIKIISMDELGVSQEYKSFLEKQLNGMLAPNCSELVIGIGHGKDGAMLVQPKDKPLKLKLAKSFKDGNGEERRGAHYGVDEECKIGFICESQKVLLGCF